MRRLLWAATVGVALAALAIATSVSEQPTLPAIGPDVERLCAEVMRRSPADRVWVAWAGGLVGSPSSGRPRAAGSSSRVLAIPEVGVAGGARAG